MTIIIKATRLETEADAQGFLESLADVLGDHDFETGEEEDFR